MAVSVDGGKEVVLSIIILRTITVDLLANLFSFFEIFFGGFKYKQMMRTKKHSICFVCKLFEGVAFLIISISNNARVLITAAFYGLFTATLGASQQNAIISID